MHVLVTGNLGYIGAWLTPLLQEAGHSVVGCDIGHFIGCDWEQMAPPDHQWIRDVADLRVADLEGIEAVIHLAALSNDPTCELDPQITRRVNFDSTLHLARIAKEAGASRFLFASSCSIYGKGDGLLGEDAPLAPLSAYAHSKVESEKELSKLACDHFSPTYLRNATAFGHSPMVRIDLVANNLLACAIARGRIEIHSDGQPWRPLVHCKDIARTFAHCLGVPCETLHNVAFNVGAENYQVCDVADAVKALVPDASIEYTGQVGFDPRDYKVSFERMRQLLPGFEPAYTLKSGLAELYERMVAHHFSEDDFVGDRFVRLRWLQAAR